MSGGLIALALASITGLLAVWLFLGQSTTVNAVARADEPASTPNALTCVPHKNFLGLRDGWDCTSTGVSDLTISTPKGTPFQFWCSGRAAAPTECKGSGDEVVQSAAFTQLAQPSDLDLAMKCHIVPPSRRAVCQVAMKVHAEKGEK